MREYPFLKGRDSIGRRKILLVEDSDVIALIAGYQIERLDVDVDRVSDGIAAVEAAKGTAYDLILMDVQMPLLGGLEAAAQIRVLEGLVSRPRVRIVGISATAGVRECLESGMDDWFCKPACYESIVRERLCRTEQAPLEV